LVTIGFIMATSIYMLKPIPQSSLYSPTPVGTGGDSHNTSPQCPPATSTGTATTDDPAQPKPTASAALPVPWQPPNLRIAMLPPTYSSTLGRPELRVHYEGGTLRPFDVIVKICNSSACIQLYYAEALGQTASCRRIRLNAVDKLSGGPYSLTVIVSDATVNTSSSLPYTLIDSGVTSPRRIGGAFIGMPALYSLRDDVCL
jgi:hypothetical protein